MFKPRMVSVVIVASLVICRSAQTDDFNVKDSRELSEHLHFIHNAYSGRRLDDQIESYTEFIRDRDIDAWKERVKANGDEKRRRSFLAEYFAYSGDYELIRADGFDVKPVTTTKHKLRIILFRPGPPIEGRDGTTLSDELKATTYMLIRKEVPIDDENPYSVFLGKAFRGQTTQQLKAIVEAYRKQW